MFYIPKFSGHVSESLLANLSTSLVKVSHGDLDKSAILPGTEGPGSRSNFAMSTVGGRKHILPSFLSRIFAFNRCLSPETL